MKLTQLAKGREFIICDEKKKKIMHSIRRFLCLMSLSNIFYHRLMRKGGYLYIRKLYYKTSIAITFVIC